MRRLADPPLPPNQPQPAVWPQKPPRSAPLTTEEYDRIRAAYAQLPARLRVIVTERFGLHGEPSRTLADLAGAFGVTPERIRQLEWAALTEMRRALGPTTLEELDGQRARLVVALRALRPEPAVRSSD